MEGELFLIEKREVHVEDQARMGCEVMETWHVRVGHVHVSWMYKTRIERDLEKAELVLDSFRIDEEPCLFRHDHHDVEQDQPFCFRLTVHDDGDSGTKVVCFGGLHIHFSCTEFGMGWHAMKHEPCDQSCVPIAIIIPVCFQDRILEKTLGNSYPGHLF